MNSAYNSPNCFFCSLLNISLFAELGVFSKKAISNRTQFGPFVAEMTEVKEEQEPCNFPLSVRYRFYYCRENGKLGMYCKS